MSAREPQEMAQVATQTGVKKTRRSWDRVLVSSFLAGAYISFGGLVAITVSSGLDPEMWGTLPTLFTGAAFTLGLVLVLIAGSDLATGNMMLVPLGAMRGKIGPRDVVVNLSLVLFGNLIGALFVAFFLAIQTGVIGEFGADAGTTAALTHERLAGIAGDKALNHTAWETFLRAVGCNWLVCLAVWMSLAATTVSGKILAIFFPIMAFVAMGFDHVVANMFFLPGGDLRRRAGHRLGRRGAELGARRHRQPGRCRRLRRDVVLVPVPQGPAGGVRPARCGRTGTRRTRLSTARRSIVTARGTFTRQRRHRGRLGPQAYECTDRDVGGAGCPRLHEPDARQPDGEGGAATREAHRLHPRLQRPAAVHHERVRPQADDVLAGEADRRGAHEVAVAEEPSHPLVRGRAPQHGRLGDLQQSPGVHHRHPVGHRERLVVVVRDIYGRGAGRAHDVGELGSQPLAQRGVQRGQRLVEQKEARRRREGAGQGHPLLLTAGQRRHRPPRRPGRPTSSSSSATRACRAGRAIPAIRRPKATLPPTSRWANSWPSWNIRPNPRRCTGTGVRSAPSQHTRPASGTSRPATTRSSVDLPQPDGPQQRDHLAGRDSERHAVHGRGRTEGDPHRVHEQPAHTSAPQVSVRSRSATAITAMTRTASTTGSGQRHPEVVRARPGDQPHDHDRQRRPVGARQEGGGAELAEADRVREPDGHPQRAAQDRQVDRGEHPPG
jgi:formate/nitrite transporter